MSTLRFIAWGSVDPDVGTTKLQRRRILKKLRKEIEAHGFKLHIGGPRNAPEYRLYRGETGLLVGFAFGTTNPSSGMYGRACGLTDLCLKVLEQIEEVLKNEQ